MDFKQLLDLAVNGPNAVLYAALNIIALFAMRVARVDQVRVLTAVGLVGGFFGAVNGFILGLTTEGVTPLVLYYNTAVGLPIGAALALLGAALVSKVPEYMNLWPISDEKAAAEAIRDPMNPASPPKP